MSAPRDIVEQAREFSRRNTSQPMAGELLDWCADEIERLQNALKEIIDNRPNQSADIAIRALHPARSSK